MLTERVSAHWEESSVMQNSRPDDNVSLVPESFHIRVVEDLDW